MDIFNPSLIPLFLEASKKEELIGLMWQNNTVNMRAFNYMPPIKEGKKWVVWFYADINTWKKPESSLMIKDEEIK